MSIPKNNLYKIIQDNEDKLKIFKKMNGNGITPQQIECEHEIEICKKLLKIK